MDDIYAALIGEAPTDKAIQMKLAEQLRRQRLLGELGQMSGDRILAPFGQGQISSADNFAKMLQDIRQKDADNAQTKSYQDAQLKHMADVLAETRRGNTLDYLASLNRDASMERRSNAGGPEYRKISDGLSKRMETGASDFAAFNDLMSSYKPEYASPGIFKTNEARIAWANANPGLSTQTAKDAARWWNQVQRFSNLPERYALFGATLTANELKSWKEATFNPSDTDDQIRAKMKVIRDIHQRKLRQIRDNAIRNGYDPEAVEGYFAGIDLGAPPPVGPGPKSGGKSTMEKYTESATGVDITQLSDEELERILNGP
jgi:hypothetical protein